MNLVGTKVAVFALSAGMAGAAGALYGVTRGSAGATDFNVVGSLFIFLLATIGGITSATGAFIGGVVFAALPIIQEDYVPSLDLRGLFIGAGAIVVSRYANGFAGLVFDRVRQRPTGAVSEGSAGEGAEGAVAVEALRG
jgi:branched-chain amino acid transport system permease protein